MAVCDGSEGKARHMAASHGISRTTAIGGRAIDIERPDFVDIITPPDSHAEICAYAAERKVNIICQKPLADGLRDAAGRIVEDAQASGVRFMVHENWRWQPWYRKIKEISRPGLDRRLDSYSRSDAPRRWMGR